MVMNMNKAKKNDFIYFSFSLKELLITAAILIAAFAFCFLIYKTDNGNTSVTLIFVLAVVFISRFTDGCLFGIIASVAAVFAVNYAFTYPYFTFNFTLSGYPMVFFTMLTVSLVTSMLTAQIKNQARIEAEIDKEKTRANLLRSVSHDIRTPLTSIIGSASAYLENHDKISEEAAAALIADVRSEAQWLIGMVENILSITRINGESAKINKNPEIAEEIIGEAVQKFRKNYPDMKVEINIPDEIIFIPMDAILIEQVIVNLMENSVIHGKTTTKITITLYSENQNAVFRVEDNGSGISKSVIPYLFDGVYKQHGIQSADDKRCMGIGLSVCMSIIKAHGGTMKAENKHSGAVFEFTLPCQEED